MKKDKEKKKKHAKREAEPAEEQKDSAPEKPSEPQDQTGDPLQRALILVGGRWKLRVLWALHDGASLRYGEIKQQIPGITDMMLSQSLRELTADGLCQRRQYQQIPPKVEYQITPDGAELLPAIELFRSWAAKH